MSAPSPQIVSDAALRQEFEDLIRRDLLGPAGGDEEVVTEQSIRNRYLLGMLAPANVVETDEEPFDELADDSEENPEEGTAEPSTPAVKRNATPSALGLSFCLGMEESEFQVQARWGQYLREQDAAGETVWKRRGRGGTQTVSLKEGNLSPWTPDKNVPQVVVRGRIRRRDDHWSVTLFLSNEQEESRPREAYWLFQAELEVTGRFAQRPNQVHVSTLDDVSRLEDRTNEMLYRQKVEFARGHGTSVEWDLAEGSWDQAIRIRTSSMPRSVVRSVEQREVPNLVTDMKELSEQGSNLASLLKPLGDAYDEWIGKLESQCANEPGLIGYADASEKIVERARGSKTGLFCISTSATYTCHARDSNAILWIALDRNRKSRCE